MTQSKQLLYLEDAERLYVEYSLSIASIEGVFKRAVTKKTLEDWKKTFNWDKIKANRKIQHQKITDRLIDLLDKCLTEAEIDPSSKNVTNVKSLLGELRSLGYDFGIENEKDKTIKPGSTDTVNKAREILGLEPIPDPSQREGERD